MELPKTRTKGMVAIAMYSQMEPLLDAALDLLLKLSWLKNLAFVLVLDEAALFTCMFLSAGVVGLLFPSYGESILWNMPMLEIPQIWR